MRKLLNNWTLQLNSLCTVIEICPRNNSVSKYDAHTTAELGMSYFGEQRNNISPHIKLT